MHGERGHTEPVPSSDPRHAPFPAHDLLTAAGVEVHREAGGVVVRADLRPCPGAPAGTGPELVDAVVALPDVAEIGGRVHAAMDVGDAATLARVHEHTDAVSTHLAGSTCIIDADVPPATDRAARPAAP